MNRFVLVIGAFVMLLAISCQHLTEKKAPQEVQLENIAAPPGAADTAILPMEEEVPNHSPQQAAASEESWDKKIIKTGTLTIESENYLQFDHQLRESVRQWGWHIASEKQNTTADKTENVMTIKVPVQYFDEAVQQLSALKGKVMDKEISSTDATGEFVDVRARLEARKSVRVQYLDILRKAKNVEDVLRVQKEINDMQEDIEAAEARMNYLQHAAAYSTIELSYYQIIDAGTGIDNPPGFTKRFWEALVLGTSGVTEFIIVAMTLWPLWLVILALTWAIRSGWAFRNKKKATTTT